MHPSATVFVVDDDEAIRGALSMSLKTAGFTVEVFASAQAFLDAYEPTRPGCLVLDVRMPGIDGLDLQEHLAKLGIRLPIIFMSAHGDIRTSVRAIRGGALDFLEKPFRRRVLLERIREALAGDAAERHSQETRAAFTARASRLTPREHEVLDLLVAGRSAKEIARTLDLSPRTVETYRARMMEKLGASSSTELAAKAVACGLCKVPIA